MPSLNCSSHVLNLVLQDPTSVEHYRPVPGIWLTLCGNPQSAWQVSTISNREIPLHYSHLKNWQDKISTVCEEKEVRDCLKASMLCILESCFTCQEPILLTEDLDVNISSLLRTKTMLISEDDLRRFLCEEVTHGQHQPLTLKKSMF